MNFIKAVKVARNYEFSHEKLVIIAGACQSNYEELIKAGANFASSPGRINIHALDPAIIATTLALTERNKEINLLNLLNIPLLVNTLLNILSYVIGIIFCSVIMCISFLS